jgi:hypothetical protein
MLGHSEKKNPRSTVADITRYPSGVSGGDEMAYSVNNHSIRSYHWSACRVRGILKGRKWVFKLPI